MLFMLLLVTKNRINPNARQPTSFNYSKIIALELSNIY